MKAMFPVPRITESFIDGVIEQLGWKRYVDLRKPVEGELNADYVTPDGILELKIFEEEGLEKIERQIKISKLYVSLNKGGDVVDITLDEVPEGIRREMENIVSGPMQTAVKKASKQIRQSALSLQMSGTGVLIAVNNGYSYLDAENFEKLVVRRCFNDSSNIDHVVCITVNYHQGDFDAYIFCTVRCHSVRDKSVWSDSEKFRSAVQSAFANAMSVMMRDQMNPELWDSGLAPVTNIRFERDGVSYVREAPHVPDSRFQKP